MRRALLSTLLFALGCGEDGASGPTVFELRITNLTTGPVDGPSGSYDALFSPGWARVSETEPLFVVGELSESRHEGLAERGDPSGFVGTDGVPYPEGVGITYDSDPLLPGATYTVRFEAEETDSLSFASMYIPTNDVVLGAEAFSLFDAEGPVVGDVTDRVALYDFGTEVNEAPGYGEGQPMRGSGGVEESVAIARVDGTDAQGHTYPSVASLVRVELVRCESLEVCAGI
ncbi:MAG: spondin domain-containing protein [Sandaracinus sp.]|nr:spondin domain-containing protein [Sandaracinus sp.]